MVSRAALLDRLLKGVPDEQPTTSKGTPTWTDFEIFQQDNLAEVECKFDKIDNQIWAKLVVMERGTRTAKAYLRNQRVWIDGSLHEFDGVRMGLRNFRNLKRDVATEMSFVLMAKGVEVQLDKDGNIWLLNKTERQLNVMSQGIKYTVYKKLEKFARSSTLLECPLWICVVHLAALELCHLLAPPTSNPDSGISTRSQLSPPSLASSHSPANSAASGRDGSLRDGSNASPKSALYARRATFVDDTYSYPRCPPIPPFAPGEMIRKASSSFDLTSDPPTNEVASNLYSVPQPYAPQSFTSFASSPRPLLISPPSSVDKNDYCQRTRGGVKKKLIPMYSNLPQLPRTHIYDCAQSSPTACVSASSSSATSTFLVPPMRYTPSRSQSIVDLRTLSALARPAFSRESQPLMHRGGTGHISTTNTYKSNPALA